ncbi:MAG TPA: ABC transporter ATP-binding protein [Thermodesulfobacteriota bacterium]|nr:ABC transporter ATP-binding protein [Thermodesulfobacteriota bacterium]
MINIKNVTKRFGRLRAVDSVSFDVSGGEAVALLGSNGAGKSTLIKCVLGLLDYTGEIILNGIDTRKDPKAAKSEIGYLPQEPVFYDMKTRDIIRFFARIRKAGTGSEERLLTEVGLSGHADKYASELSGGMRQRLSFAVALLSEPHVLLLDEPTSNLDARARADFLKLVKEYKDRGKTVVFSSHRLDEVDYLADRVVLMREGRLVFEGSPKLLKDSLGLRLRASIHVREGAASEAAAILSAAGITVHGRNGSGLVVDVAAGDRMKPVRELITREIEVVDFIVEEPAMERILEGVGTNGD